jgi:hypothetical protein
VILAKTGSRVKEQSSRRIRAHLLRGVLYLLLLFGICMIPLVLSQQRTIKRTEPAIAQSDFAAFPKGCGLASRVVPSPNSSANTNILFGVAPYSPTSIWAVGSYYDDTFTAKTLVEFCDGSGCTVFASPNPGTTGNQLNAVATFGGFPWAVGFFTDDNFIAHTLVEYWDASVWNVVPSPDNGSNGSYLQGVTGLAFDDVWAVGYSVDDTQVNQTLIEHWERQLVKYYQ